MKPRPDLLDPNSPAGIEVFQLTEEPTVPGAHIYMEVQTFTPDSRRFILHRSANAHCDYQYRFDPEHHILTCDLDQGGEPVPVITELGATAPSVSPDGKFIYYLLDETEPPGRGQLSLKRVRLDADRLTQLVVGKDITNTIFVFCPETYAQDNQINARLFAPAYGIPEDPATGSANSCLAAYLVKHRYFNADTIDVKVEQGYEIDRPSRLYLKAYEKPNRNPCASWGPWPTDRSRRSRVYVSRPTVIVSLLSMVTWPA